MNEFDLLYDQIVQASNSRFHAISKNRIWYTWTKISPLLFPESRVIEIGVGPMSVIAKELAHSRVTGADIDDWQAPLCEEFNIDLKICDVQNAPLPVDDESIDALFLLEVIEHLCMYPNDLFDNIYKKLRKGGYLIVSSVNLLRISNRIRMIIGKSPLVNRFEKTVDGRNHIREFYPDEMAYYLRKSGFNIKGIYNFGIPGGGALMSVLLRLAYFYSPFRNYFLIIGKK